MRPGTRHPFTADCAQIGGFQLENTIAPQPKDCGAIIASSHAYTSTYLTSMSEKSASYGGAELSGTGAQLTRQ